MLQLVHEPSPPVAKSRWMAATAHFPAAVFAHAAWTAHVQPKHRQAAATTCLPAALLYRAVWTALAQTARLVAECLWTLQSKSNRECRVPVDNKEYRMLVDNNECRRSVGNNRKTHMDSA
eukprot:1142368-Pelagomonas_calceolata.AAC.9